MLGRIFPVLIVLLLSMSPLLVSAGVVVGGTRLIYFEDKADATISIYNKNTELPYLLQVWVDPFNSTDKTKVPFTAIPPVSRLEPQQEKLLRIIKIPGALPHDRESVFWLNIKNIPPTSATAQSSSLDIAIKTRIKLFWRPAAIKLIPENVAQKVRWHRQANQLVVENPSPLHINVMDVVVDGNDVPLNMIRPFETLTLPLPAGVVGHSLVWRFINDYGAVSAPLKQSL